jgi:hypothetical protein
MEKAAASRRTPNGRARCIVPLLGNAGFIPVDDVDELPGILVELKFELAFFVDDKLSGGIEDAGALIFVLVVDFNFTSGQIVSSGLGVGIDFTEAKQAVGDETNLAAGVGGDETDKAEVVAKSAGDGDASDGAHFGEGVNETLILSLFEGIDEDLAILFGGEFVDGDLDVDDFAELGAGALGGGVDDFGASVVGRNSESDGSEKKNREQKSAEAELASFGVRIVVKLHGFPFEKAGRMPESGRQKNADSGPES